MLHRQNWMMWRFFYFFIQKVNLYDDLNLKKKKQTRGMRLIKIRKRYKKESTGLGTNPCADVGVIRFVGTQKLPTWKPPKGTSPRAKATGFHNRSSWVIRDRILRDSPEGHALAKIPCTWNNRSPGILLYVIPNPRFLFSQHPTACQCLTWHCWRV